MEAPIRDSLGNVPIPQSWVTWFKTVDNFIRSGSSSGTTANRPTKNLFVGLSYMDDDLGKQIQIKSLNPTVWVDSNGDDPDVPAVVTPTVYPMNVKLCQYGYLAAMPINLFSCYDGYALQLGGLRRESATPVIIDGQTQARMICTYNGGTPIASSRITVAYSTTTTYYPSLDLGLGTGGLSAGIVIIDSGWLDLPTGLTGLIYCAPAAYGGDNIAANSAIEGMVLFLK